MAPVTPIKHTLVMEITKNPYLLFQTGQNKSRIQQRLNAAL